MSDFDVAFGFTMLREGGLANDPADHGGLTKRGLTQATYDAFRDLRSLPRRSVILASDGEIYDAALEIFWTPAGCAKLRAPASLVHFDNAYITTPRRAVMILQATLGVLVDGIFGQQTESAAHRRVPEILAHDLGTVRRGYHLKAVVDDETQRKFLAGWIARCDALDDFVAKTGVVG